MNVPCNLKEECHDEPVVDEEWQMNTFASLNDLDN
jgi:hypothetical protein